MILSVTGHRPERLGGYGDDTLTQLTDFAAIQIVRFNPEKVITGMALGWDMAVAIACAELCMPFIAAVPFKAQPNVWPKRMQTIYHAILERAEVVEVISPGNMSSSNMPQAFQLRNEWMVDHCGKLLALYSGTHGGTHNCVEYAKRRGVEVVNVWQEWKAARVWE